MYRGSHPDNVHEVAAINPFRLILLPDIIVLVDFGRWVAAADHCGTESHLHRDLVYLVG
jgi:hypothetical protein